MPFTYAALIFVIETDPIAKTDERYIKKFLHVHYDNLYSHLFTLNFVYTCSKSKYNSPAVQKEISDTIKLIPFKETTICKVIYCFDRDRINKDKKKMNEIQEYVKQQGHEFVLFSKDIENCFNPKWCGSKVETAKKYYNTAGKIDIPLNVFEKPIDVCKKLTRCSNLNLVVKNILNKIKI